MAEKNPTKFLTGLIIGLALALFGISLYEFISKGKFNTSTTIIGLAMLILAYATTRKKESK
jgi:hypothetical protein